MSILEHLNFLAVLLGWVVICGSFLIFIIFIGFGLFNAYKLAWTIVKPGLIKIKNCSCKLFNKIIRHRR